MDETDELVVADLPEEQQQYVCVEFPGIVDNVDKAISSLGGINAISRTHHEKNRRLEMRFRPDDIYSKPTVARADSVSNLVLSVKRRRKKRGGANNTGGRVEGAAGRSEGGEEYEYSAELMGVVDTSYRFGGMADFQVLPPGLSDITYKGMPVDPMDFQLKEPLDETYSDRDLPTFLAPSLFSKFDKPITYAFRQDSKASKTGGKMEDGNPASSSKKKLYNTYGIAFDFKGSIPTEPHPDATTTTYTSHPKMQELRQLFEERPVWSRPALQWRVKLPQGLLRSLLSLVAYKFTSGPFKKMWVKFGYDPRSDPASKVYQSLDIRVSKEMALIESERSKSTRRRPGQFLSGSDDTLEDKPVGTNSAEAVEETTFMFFPDKLPAQRQIHYQLCDLREDQLQAMIHCNDSKETECTETNGWCEDNTYTKLRKAMTVLIKKTAQKMKKNPDSAGLDEQEKAEQSDNSNCEPMETQ